MPRREPDVDHRTGNPAVVSDGQLQLQFDDVIVDVSAYRVSRHGRPIELGPLEYRLLCFFLRNPLKAFTREEIIESVWPAEKTIDTRTVDVHVARLRRSLTQYGHADPIRTVRTVGYSLG